MIIMNFYPNIPPDEDGIFYVRLFKGDASPSNKDFLFTVDYDVAEIERRTIYSITLNKVLDPEEIDKIARNVLEKYPFKDKYKLGIYGIYGTIITTTFTSTITIEIYTLEILNHPDEYNPLDLLLLYHPISIFIINKLGIECYNNYSSKNKN